MEAYCVSGPCLVAVLRIVKDLLGTQRAWRYQPAIKLHWVRSIRPCGLMPDRLHLANPFLSGLPDTAITICPTHWHYDLIPHLRITTIREVDTVNYTIKVPAFTSALILKVRKNKVVISDGYFHLNFRW